MIIIIAMTGTATTPLITALHLFAERFFGIGDLFSVRPPFLTLAGVRRGLDERSRPPAALSFLAY
jgi:hypothetical protein